MFFSQHFSHQQRGNSVPDKKSFDRTILILGKQRAKATMKSKEMQNDWTLTRINSWPTAVTRVPVPFYEHLRPKFYRKFHNKNSNFIDAPRANRIATTLRNQSPYLRTTSYDQQMFMFTTVYKCSSLEVEVIPALIIYRAEKNLGSEKENKFSFVRYGHDG